MAPKNRTHKNKSKAYDVNPMLPPTIDLDHQPLVDQKYKITNTNYDFELYELHDWLKHKYLDLSDELVLWESSLPQFIFPQTHHFPDFVSWFQFRYIPNQRAIVTQKGDIVFIVTTKYISQMLQLHISDSMKSFSVVSLIEF